MMGPRQVEQGALFYNFSLDAHVPPDHPLRSVVRAESGLDLTLSTTASDPFKGTIGVKRGMAARTVARRTRRRGLG